MKQLVFKRLDNHKMGLFVFWICWMVYFTSYIGRYNYSAAMAEIVSNGVLPLSQVGLIGTAYFLSYGIGQLINGFVGDKLSPFTMIFAGLIVSGSANIVMGFLNTYPSMSLIWAINGFSQSMIWSPILRIFSEILPREQQNRACINVASTIPAGTLGSYALSTLMMSMFSWKAVFWAAGIFMIFISVVWLLSSRKVVKACPLVTKPIGTDNQSALQTANQKTHKNPMLGMLIASGVIILIIPIAIHGVLKDGMTSWVPTFITETFKTSPSLSVVFTMVLPIVNLSGAYVADWLNRKVFKDELLASAVMFMVALAALFGIFFLGKLHIVLTVLCLALVTSSMMGINTLFISIVPVRLGRNGGASSISGLLNSIAYMGCALSTWGIGFCVERFGWTITTLTWVVLAGIAVILTLAGVRRWKRWCTTNDPI